ncbi:MAG TPA: hypothetical protein DCE42_09625 [Myxococcales bacterium]|nr:hypothetical protein [Deltaproteobacteria bacterium]HAA55006.1 hypothetical protein [Myxococcales bacterium]|tara:strand:- start:14396 stop:15325 length:930 start_codon:yes stop_codon:yes gene_type:complete
MHNEDKDVRELLSIQQEQIQKLQYTHRQFRALIYRTIAGLVGCTVLFVMTNVLMAQSAPLVYSGYLEEKGKPIDVKKDVKFTLWSAASGGTAPLCTDEFPDTDFVRGRFKLPLKNCLTTFQQKTSLWAELSIKPQNTPATDYKSTGRQQVSNTPYAKSSQNTISDENILIQSNKGKIDIWALSGKKPIGIKSNGNISIEAGDDLKLSGAKVTIVSRMSGAVIDGDLQVNGTIRTTKQSISCRTVSVKSTSTKDWYVKCPSDTIMTGGGIEVPGNAALVRSRPTSKNDGWECQANTTAEKTCYVRCCSTL